MIAIIGVEGICSAHVRFFKWLDDSINIDTVEGLILYFPSFPKWELKATRDQLTVFNNIERHSLPMSIPVPDRKPSSEKIKLEDSIKRQQQILAYIKKNINRLLASGMTVIGIGLSELPPEFFIKTRYENREVYAFLPLFSQSNFPRVNKYFEKVTHTQGCILEPELDIPLIAPHLISHYGQVTGLIADKNVYFETQDHRTIAVGLYYKYYIMTKTFTSGEFIIIPSIQQVLPSENVIFALAAFYDLTLIPAPPLWVQNIGVEGEEPLRTQLNEKQMASQNLEQQIESLHSALDRSRDCIKLLYSRDSDLVGAVIAALVELGFDCPEYLDRMNEDYFIQYKDIEYVLEISGTEGNITRKKLRQSYDWVAKCADQGRKCKGVFIINPWREKEPNLRNESKSIHPEDLKFANRLEIAILLTRDLFELVQRKRRSEFCIAEFAGKLARCNGLIELE